MSHIIENINEFKEKAEGKNITTPLPDDNLINLYEKELNFIFPEEYRFFLLEAMNYYLGDIMFYQLTKEKKHVYELLIHAREAWKLGVPKDRLAFADDNGNYFCIDKNGLVHYWSHGGETSEKWPDFKTWLKKVWIDENVS